MNELRDNAQSLDAAGTPEPKGPQAHRPLPADAMILLPVRSMVMFPGMVVPIGIGRERSRAAIQEAVRLERPIGVLLQRDAQVEAPEPRDLY